MVLSSPSLRRDLRIEEIVVQRGVEHHPVVGRARDHDIVRSHLHASGNEALGIEPEVGAIAIIVSIPQHHSFGVDIDFDLVPVAQYVAAIIEEPGLGHRVTAQ